ncbi:MAG: T9SS type A sorting domain-containing protein [Bacteroidetes bacterium]|nr:T9SS type A sorting domain-containing protein [Bacteroidota bacterium]
MTQKIIVFILFLLAAGASNAQDTCLTYLKLGISFPPVSDNSQRSFANTHLNTLGVNKIRFAEDWALREPTKGNFNWKPLDERINWAFENNYEILLTIQSNAPSWACSSAKNEKSCVFNDNNDFKIYIDSLLKRYAGKIAKIQFGNEWQSSYWYIGNAGDFIAANNTVYNSVRINSPLTKFILGGFTSASLRFMAGCNGYVSSFYDDDGNYFDSTFLSVNCSTPTVQTIIKRIDSVLQYAQYDMLDIHLYDDVEQWDKYYLNFLQKVNKPIIVSEFGGPNMNYEAYSEAYQANRLYQYIKKLDSLQIKEAYYFKLIEGSSNAAHSKSGLIDGTTATEKPAYFLFKSFTHCITSVQEQASGAELKVFPNPTSEKLTIASPLQQFDTDTVQIYDSMGSIVKTVGINQPLTVIDILKLSSGLYYIRSKNNTAPTLKFIKQ